MATIQQSLINLINENIKVSQTIKSPVKTTGYMLKEVLLSMASNGGGTPIGTVVAWKGETHNVPYGWMICDGENGTPDLRGRFIVGVDPNDPDISTVDKIGGANKVTLSKSQMPLHTHELEDFSAEPHKHQVGGKSSDRNTSGAGYSINQVSKGDYDKGGSAQTSTSTEGGLTENNVTLRLSEEGGGQAHENRPPFYSLIYIIYVGIEGDVPTFLNENNRVDLITWSDYSNFEYLLEVDSIATFTIVNNTANLPLEVVGTKLVKTGNIPIPATEDVVTVDIVATNGYGSTTLTVELWRFIPDPSELSVAYSNLVFTENSVEKDPKISETSGWSFLLNPAVNNPENLSLIYKITSVTPDVSPITLPFFWTSVDGVISTKYPMSSNHNGTYTLTVETSVSGSSEYITNTVIITIDLPELILNNSTVTFVHQSYSSYVQYTNVVNDSTTYMTAYYNKSYTIKPKFTLGTLSMVTKFRVSSEGDSISYPHIFNITTGEISISNLPIGRKSFVIVAEINDGSLSKSMLTIDSIDPNNTGGSTGCLIEGTMISTYDGDVAIESLKAGDKLISNKIKGMPETNDVDILYSWSSNEFNPIPIESTIVSVVPIVRSRTYLINGMIESTGDHTHIVNSNGDWIMKRMDEIKVGEYFYGIDKQLILIQNIILNSEQVTVYKITLDSQHTFYANGILTHNAKQLEQEFSAI